MMFSGQKGSSAFNIFGQKLRGESSLTTGLLNDVPPEIELSDYRRVPSPGSESPSGLLDGEQLNVKPIADLDLFFERLYHYYCEKGLWCIIVKWIFELFSLAFTICFSGFFLLYVDWNGLRKAKCGMDAVESGVKPCDLAKEALNRHPLTPFTISKAIIVGYLGIFTVYWIFCFLRFFIQLKETLKVREFYHNSLQITDNEIQTMPWALVLEKVVQLQSSQQICVVRDLSIHDIVMRLMRKENYLIGMINKGLLAFPISSWVPGAGPTVRHGPNGVRHRLILTKTLEWSLNWCILQSMFDRNFCIRRDFIDDPEALKKRLRIVGLLNVLLSPFLVIFMLVYLFLRHAEQFYHHPSTASSRRWSNLSKWNFREFNEVDHFFKHRISSSIGHASNYLKQFPTPIITLVAKFISFVSGGFAAVLIIIAIMEASLLEGHVYGHNLLWYTAVFGTVTAISRAAVADELPVPDPQGAMSLLVQHTHYMPKRWRGKENTEAVRMEFETLFQYTGMMLLEEMASIFLTPYLLLFVVPKRVNDILKFIADFTVDVEGVGHVCSFSLFNFQIHGNSRYGSPYNASQFHRSSQGKMEKSFLSFQTSYPAWEPNDQGKRFLSALKKFKQQKLQVLGFRPPYLSPLMQQWDPNFRGLNDRNSYVSRGSPFNNVGAGYQSDLMVITDGEQHNHPYILDWYYTSQLQRTTDDEDARSRSRSFHDSVVEQTNENSYKEESWGDMLHDRARTHIEASTSAPLLRDLVMQNHDANIVSEPTNSHWWARGQFHGPDLGTSFCEPPNFDVDKGQFLDNYSDKSNTEEQVDWQNSNNRLSRTFLMDDLAGGDEFSLPFDDIYRRQSRPDSPANNLDPADRIQYAAASRTAGQASRMGILPGGSHMTVIINLGRNASDSLLYIVSHKLTFRRSLDCHVEDLCDRSHFKILLNL